MTSTSFVRRGRVQRGFGLPLLPEPPPRSATRLWPTPVQVEPARRLNALPIRRQYRTLDRERGEASGPMVERRLRRREPTAAQQSDQRPQPVLRLHRRVDPLRHLLGPPEDTRRPRRPTTGRGTRRRVATRPGTRPHLHPRVAVERLVGIDPERHLVGERLPDVFAGEQNDTPPRLPQSRSTCSGPRRLSAAELQAHPPGRLDEHHPSDSLPAGPVGCSGGSACHGCLSPSGIVTSWPDHSQTTASGSAAIENGEPSFPISRKVTRRGSARRGGPRNARRRRRAGPSR